MAYKRIKGGEKNLKSGVRWTKDEIILVYKLYKKLNGVGLHEHNPEIQKLAGRLGRTVRSTEAQTLMFRNLERTGKYSHGNMNKLSKEVWREFELDDNSAKLGDQENESETESSTDQLVNTIPDELKYSEWNKLLINHYFNDQFENQEIACFPVSEELFLDITNFEFSIDDFIYSMSKIIGSKKFFERLEQLYENSLPKTLAGRSIRKPLPDYFGFLIFIIFALSEDEGDDLTVANVYDRINNYGKEVLGAKWNNISTSVARDILEPIWTHLEEWSCSFKNGFSGKFKKHDPKNSGRKYVSRIERHSLFNSRHFTLIVDLLIDDGYLSNQIISLEEWRDFFTKHLLELGNAKTVLKYLSEDGPLQISIVKFLNSYCKQHFTKHSIASAEAEYRKPPIHLKLCIAELPLWTEDPIKEFYFRAESDSLKEDFLINENQISLMNPYVSDKIKIELDLNDGAMIKSGESRFATNKRKFWLSKNHKLNEWSESDSPSNDSTFLLVIEKKILTTSPINSDIAHIEYSLENTTHVVLKFNNLSVEHFDEIYKLYNPYNKIEGKIELISTFTSDRRRCIYKELNPLFKYIGPKSMPNIQAIDTDSRFVICDLIKLPESDSIFRLPEDFSHQGEFQIKEEAGNIKSRYNFYLGDLSREPSNISFKHVKDIYGRNLVDEYRREQDILDIPENFYTNFDVPKFNEWHQRLFKLFKSGQTIKTEIDGLEIKNSSKGDLLLRYIAQSENINTYDFPKLIRELDPTVSRSYSKRIMDHWRHLGYINFQDYGEQVKVNPTAIFFLRTTNGLKGYLSGYRSSEFIDRLKVECKTLSIRLVSEGHAQYKNELYPSKLVLYDQDCELSKFHELKSRLNIDFVNNIQHALNPSYVIYQLACLYYQQSVNEFIQKLDSLKNYHTDHHRKRIFDPINLKWKDSNLGIEDLDELNVVRYDGFRDNSMSHIIKYNGKSKILKELYIGIFASLNSHIIYRMNTNDNKESDLLVPFSIGLPFWIERGLILINAEIPELHKNGNKSFRKYKNIPAAIIDVIGEKLNQKIETYD